MSRLAPLDKALVVILVPVWAVCFGLALRTQVEAGGYPFIGLSIADAESYPVLTGDFGTGHPSNPLEGAGLRKGDLLVRAVGVDLRGTGTLAFMGLVKEAAGRRLAIPLVYERGGMRLETSLELQPVSGFLPNLAISFSFAASALLLLVRARATRSVRAYFLAAFCLAIATCVYEPIHAWAWTSSVGGGLLIPLLLRLAQVFPDDVAPEGRWHRVWPWLLAISGVFAGLSVAGRYRLGGVGLTGTMVLGLAAILAVSTHKYRYLDPVARRQMKWVLCGAYGAALPFVLAFAIALFEPGLVPLAMLSFWAVPIFPVALVVSVLRFNLFDVDRLLSAAASYNILLVLVVGGGLAIVPRVAESASGLLGIDAGTSQVVLSLALAAVVVPAHRRLRPQIDRMFFKERYALDHGIAELLPTLSACTDTPELTERAGEGLHGLFRPEVCVVYAAAAQNYAPVFVEGRVVPPAFEGNSPLIATLRQRRVPISLSTAGRRPDETPLGPFDRAALETLQAEVVLPVRQDDALAAFLCLGPKRSGDVYTSADLSLLAVVAETVSHQLQRFDQQEVIREGREMQQSLRRYVPGAVAEQLASGTEPTSGEREVSVLFVDIRDYTSIAETRRAEEIFLTVNRYTETVSQIVQKHGGSVVEFNGDGMMTVFGAPRELAYKERAAVEAGREIVKAVAALPVEGAEAKLRVGVGIATGEAFVGNIQAVDRMIWSAIGNTTNLAARLQGMTRELDASLVIDDTTQERARPAAEGFERKADVPIRGRRETQDVYALPMGSDS